MVCIYAVLGLQFFRDQAPDSFGSFDTSFVTLFGVVSTIQPWPSDLPLLIPDPMPAIHNSSRGISSNYCNESGTIVNGGSGSGNNSTRRSQLVDYGVVCFAYSFAIICILMLLQVVLLPPSLAGTSFYYCLIS